MKHFTLIFAACLFVSIVAVPTEKAKAVPVDEVEAMLSKVSKNIESASQATKMAQTMNAKMVEAKVQEKEELKKEVKQAEAKMEAMEQKIEVYAVKMIGSGIDTATEEVQYTGPAYEAWLNYVEEGGKEDFNWFRLYIWQQK